MNITEFKAGDIVEYEGKIYKIASIQSNRYDKFFVLYDWVNDPHALEWCIAHPEEVKISEAIKVLYGIPK